MELTNGLNDFCSIDFLCNQNCSIFTVQSFFVQSTWNHGNISTKGGASGKNLASIEPKNAYTAEAEEKE